MNLICILYYCDHMPLYIQQITTIKPDAPSIASAYTTEVYQGLSISLLTVRADTRILSVSSLVIIDWRKPSAYWNEGMKKFQLSLVRVNFSYSRWENRCGAAFFDSSFNESKLKLAGACKGGNSTMLSANFSATSWTNTKRQN